MKKKTKEFVQNIYHDIEEGDADEYLKKSLPLVGSVVMNFNSLEKSLDSFLCETLTDRTDSVGLIVLQKLSYSAKIDLFKRFCDDFHLAVQKKPKKYKGLIEDLAEIGRLRNLVVHADWENTDHEGYTFVKIKTSSKGMEQEYVQFSAASLKKLIKQIVIVNQHLSDYWEERSDILTRW